LAAAIRRTRRLEDNVDDHQQGADVPTKRDALLAGGLVKSTRPWGWYASIAAGPGFQVKRIHVSPGASLSLQSHVHRAENWVVVLGVAEITLADRVYSLGVGESVFINKGQRHRLANRMATELEIIEVQMGSYLGEDDIVRYEDVYGRN
jgi:mannose-1-phosphate guanylyltransferase / mannose-6-phosphate isomerase